MSNTPLNPTAYPLLYDLESSTAFPEFELGSDLSTVQPSLETTSTDDTEYLRNTRDGLNDMSQGWGVLFPDSDTGRELREAIAELVEFRRAALKKSTFRLDVQEWAIPSSQTANEFYRQYSSLRRVEQPYYLLILGDFDQIPASYDIMMNDHVSVGRLCFPNIDDYRTYATKVVRAETSVRNESSRDTPQIVVYSPHGVAKKKDAVDIAHGMLVKPLLTHFREEHSAAEVVFGGPHADTEHTSWGKVREELQRDAPTVLLSVSHGAGVTKQKVEGQRILQGRMVTEAGPLNLDTIRESPFLKNGVWFNYACFSGGTPRSSSFAPMMRRLRSVGGKAPDVSQTVAGDRPFVALQPQLALANPDGPLAIFGHIDTAFMYTFAAYEQIDGRSRLRPRPRALQATFDELISGSRFGVARHMLGDAILSSSHDVTDIYQRAMAREDEVVRRLLESSESLPLLIQKRVRTTIQQLRKQHKPNEITLSKIAAEARMPLVWLLAPFATTSEKSRLLYSSHTWLAYHDLRSWILLGDPAARLPLAKNQVRPLVTATDFFGESFMASKKGSEQASEKSKDPPTRTDDEEPPSADLLPAIPCAPSNFLTAVKSFQEARGNSGLEQEISDDFGIDLDTLTQWRDHGEKLLLWAIKRAKAQTQS